MFLFDAKRMFACEHYESSLKAVNRKVFKGIKAETLNSETFSLQIKSNIWVKYRHVYLRCSILQNTTVIFNLGHVYYVPSL